MTGANERETARERKKEGKRERERERERGGGERVRERERERERGGGGELGRKGSRQDWLTRSSSYFVCVDSGMLSTNGIHYTLPHIATDFLVLIQQTCEASRRKLKISQDIHEDFKTHANSF